MDSLSLNKRIRRLKQIANHCAFEYNPPERRTAARRLLTKIGISWFDRDMFEMSLNRHK